MMSDHNLSFRATARECRFRGERLYRIPRNRIDYHDACYALVEGLHGPGVRSLVALAIRGIHKHRGKVEAQRALRHLRSIQGAIPVWGGPDGTTLVKS